MWALVSSYDEAREQGGILTSIPIDSTINLALKPTSGAYFVRPW